MLLKRINLVFNRFFFARSPLPLGGGSSLTLGEFRTLTKNMPDDLFIRIQETKYGSSLAFRIYRDEYHVFGDCLLIDNSGGKYQPKKFG